MNVPCSEMNTYSVWMVTPAALRKLLLLGSKHVDV